MPVSIADVGFIIGKWEGTGFAEYPTILPVDYDEGLLFTRNDKDPVIHYEQRAWRKSADKRNGEPLFWESGFFIDKGNGLFELVSAQRSGRVEILRGEAKAADGGAIEIGLFSVSISNDARMIKSGRRYRFAENVLDYELRMSTTENPAFDRHLMARLKRQGL